MSNNKQQLACLYTKHKTQKRKVWQDGRLVLKGNSNKAILHDANPPPGSGDPSLGECEITSSQLQAILQQFGSQNGGINTGPGLLETERFLIEIEGPWANNNSTSFSTLSASNTLQKRQLNGKKNGSSSMKKLLSSKFQKPKSYVPPPPGTQRSRMEQRLGKRRRPLQPGELVARHYGGGSGNAGGNRGGFDYPQTNFNNQQGQDYRGDNYHPQHIRGNLSDNFGRGLPVARPSAQPSGQGETATSIENTNHGMNASFRTFKNRDIVVPGSGTGVSRGAGNAATGSRVGRLQQHSQYGRAGSQRKSNTLSFVQNEFDSTRYYGTDEEDEGGDEDLSPPKASTFAQGLVDARKGEQHQQQQLLLLRNDRNSQTQNCDERTYRKNSGIFVGGDSLQKVGNTLEHQEMQSQNDANQTYSHQNRCQSSTPSLAPVNTRNKNENLCETRNDNKNDIQSVSKVLVAEQRSGPLQSHHHGKTELDYDDEESEEDDEEFSDGDIAAPVPFQLKALSAPSDANKSKDGTTSSSVSGNRLLALFGAGVNDTNKTSKKRESEKENSMMAVNSNGESKSKNVDGSQQNNRSYGGVKKDEMTNSDEGNANSGHLGDVGGFYLPPADTSSEESSDDDSDEE